MARDTIIKAVQDAAVNGRLTCEKAHELAKNLNVSLREIGEICNGLKIKIGVCQLGCF